MIKRPELLYDIACQYCVKNQSVSIGCKRCLKTAVDPTPRSEIDMDAAKILAFADALKEAFKCST